MSPTRPRPDPQPWSRARPTRSGPRRNAGGLYRTAEGPRAQEGAPAQGGVPLSTANAAVVAAVRLAYEVAEAQVARSTRLARRLREAGDKQSGPYSDSQALDAAERLVMNALMSGLEWWEGSVAEGRCPVKRLAGAEYRMLGSILGFGPAPEAKAANAQEEQAVPRPRAGSPQDAQRKARDARGELPVVLKGEKKHRRHVVVRHWDIASADQLDPGVFFHCDGQAGIDPLAATLEVDAAGKMRLAIETPPGTPGGRWVCAVWNKADVQVGSIEITL